MTIFWGVIDFFNSLILEFVAPNACARLYYFRNI